MKQNLKHTLLIVALTAGSSVYASEGPGLDVSAQKAGNEVTISSVKANASGFVVIHDSNTEGKPVVPSSIGHTMINAGHNSDVKVTLDHTVKVGEKLFVMLHEDTGKKGIYEFGPGSVNVDKPVVDEGHVVVKAFTINGMK
ncbi:MAG TPA: hypothetical protein ENH62_10175 [Marinobacter sp.]|uniref:DUF7282 domain-containing protein n=2 Tax=root TaxID=1 RepID=A0A831R6V5_9GAMM|nr:hypothetical protein [Marinobacter antarcticus]HDZ38636.1 hypothetical protein [Marinobacter sp.]HEA53136.1 hypothetical protein [Marinobacter antarcticus]